MAGVANAQSTERTILSPCKQYGAPLSKISNFVGEYRKKARLRQEEGKLEGPAIVPKKLKRPIHGTLLDTL